jgi:low affinity Fe/Cu permease
LSYTSGDRAGGCGAGAEWIGGAPRITSVGEACRIPPLPPSKGVSRNALRVPPGLSVFPMREKAGPALWHPSRREPKFRSRLSFFMKRLFADLATAVAYLSGRAATFLIAIVIIVVWAISGPIFHYSDSWQLIINTGTTIVTFLMVFVIQNTQNRDGAAIQAKLDELIRVSKARNSLIGIEALTQEEIAEIRAEGATRVQGNPALELKRRGGKKAKATGADKTLS